MRMFDLIKKEFVEVSFSLKRESDTQEKHYIIVFEGGRPHYETPKLKPVKEPEYELRP